MANEFPIPADATAGSREIESAALNLVRQASWIYRLSQEYLDAAEINVIALNELISNCNQFVQTANDYRDGAGDYQSVLDAISRIVQEKSGVVKSTTETNQILRDLYDEATTFHAWAVSNFSSIYPSCVVGGALNNGRFGLTITAPKVAALTTRVQALRDRFI